MAGGSRRGADARLAELIAGGMPVETAARQVGVSRQTAFRRLQEPPFRAEVLRLRQRLRDETIGMLAQAGLMSALVLRQLLNSSDERTRLRAASVLLGEGRLYADASDLAERVAALEAGAAGAEDDGEQEPGRWAG